MKKVTAIIFAAALIIGAAVILVFEINSPPENSTVGAKTEKAEEKTYSKTLYEEFTNALSRFDYIEANRLYSKNYAENGVNFPVENFDPTFGGKIYAYDFDVPANEKTGEEAAAGTLYIVDPELDLSALSLRSNDYFALDRRTNADPEFVVLNSYRATGSELIKTLCSILLSHEENHPSNWERTLNSLKEEWEIHNLAYELDYKVDHAKDVNLNNGDENTDWMKRAMYDID